MGESVPARGIRHPDRLTATKHPPGEANRCLRSPLIETRPVTTPSRPERIVLERVPDTVAHSRSRSTGAGTARDVGDTPAVVGRDGARVHRSCVADDGSIEYILRTAQRTCDGVVSSYCRDARRVSLGRSPRDRRSARDRLRSRSGDDERRGTTARCPVTAVIVGYRNVRTQSKHDHLGAVGPFTPRGVSNGSSPNHERPGSGYGRSFIPSGRVPVGRWRN